MGDKRRAAIHWAAALVAGLVLAQAAAATPALSVGDQFYAAEPGVLGCTKATAYERYRGAGAVVRDQMRMDMTCLEMWGGKNRVYRVLGVEGPYLIFRADDPLRGPELWTRPGNHPILRWDAAKEARSQATAETRAERIDRMYKMLQQTRWSDRFDAINKNHDIAALDIIPSKGIKGGVPAVFRKYGLSIVDGKYQCEEEFAEVKALNATGPGCYFSVDILRTKKGVQMPKGTAIWIRGVDDKTFRPQGTPAEYISDTTTKPAQTWLLR